jgi:chromosome partitioning protein
MRLIAIVNQKGGSGKTTTTVSLAASLAEKGKNVLVIDLDPQASASLWFGFKDKGKHLFEVLTGPQPLSHAIEKTKIEHVDMIPSSPLLAGIEKALASEVGAEKILKSKFESLPHKPWDYVLIDCPPTLGLLSLNALSFAHEVLVPVETHVMALHGLVQLLKTIQIVKERLNPTLKLSGILPCRVDLRTKHSPEVLDQLKARFKEKVLGCYIRENVKLAEAPLHVKPIIQYADKSNGANDYRSLAEALITQEISKRS